MPVDPHSYPLNGDAPAVRAATFHASAPFSTRRPRWLQVLDGVGVSIVVNVEPSVVVRC